VYRATANEPGQYTIANLRDGTYVLRAKGAGCQEFQVDNLVLTGLDNRAYFRCEGSGGADGAAADAAAGVGLFHVFAADQ